MVFMILHCFCAGLSLARADDKGRQDDKLAATNGNNFVKKTIRSLISRHNFKVFGKQLTYNIVPFVYPHFRTGWNFGFLGEVLPVPMDPYRYRLTFLSVVSHKGRHKHKLVLDYPSILSSKFGLYVRADWRRALQARYFGIGNDSVKNGNLTDPGNQAFVDKDFYLYNLKHLRLTFHGTREILPNVSFWFGGGVQSIDPQLKDGPETSFLGANQPFGFLGGSGKFLSFRLNWDTRWEKIFPLGGFLAEFSFEPNSASVQEEVSEGGDVTRQSRSVRFNRYTFSYAHFWSLKPNRLVLANRFAYEAIAGTAPYYEFGEMAGRQRIRVLGGSQALRGFPSRRFQDKIKFMNLTELRYHYRNFEFLSEPFDLILAAFWDKGRVWGQSPNLSLDGFHSTLGLGAWLVWNYSRIIRVDFGRSTEGFRGHFGLSSAF